MGLFKKKKVEPAPPIEIKTPCELGNHIYKDFPPYLTYSGAGNNPYVQINESYVCHLCGKRVDKVLERKEWNYSMRAKDFQEEVQRVRNHYKDWLMPMARVNDMINDTILVDRMKLKYWEQLHTIDEAKEEVEKNVSYFVTASKQKEKKDE